MRRTGWMELAVLVGAALVTAGCNQFEVVTVEFVNLTPWEIDPGLYVYEDDDLLLPFLIAEDENYVDVGTAPPNTTIFTRLTCEEAGTLLSYEAVAFRPGEDYVSDNDPWVDRDDDFDCFDTISFVFIRDGDGFYIEIDVNGEFVTD